MKIVFDILLFTFVVFFNSNEVSSQSSSGSSGGESSSGTKPTYTTIIEYLSPVNAQGIAEAYLANLSPGHHILLPNGNIYVSTGTGAIHITYYTHDDIVKVEQRGSRNVKLYPRDFQPESFKPGQWVTIVKLQGNNRPHGFIVKHMQA